MALPNEQAKITERMERSARYLWAAQVAEGRSTLDLGCGDGTGTAVLSDAGASPVLGIDPSAEAIDRARKRHDAVTGFEVGGPASLPVGEGDFDLITCFGPLEASPDPDAVINGIERALKPGGLLLASLPVAGGEAPGPQETLRRRFRSVELHEQGHYAGTAVDWPRDGEVTARAAGPEEPALRTVLAAASDAPLPLLEPRATFEPAAGLEPILDSLSQWEERAREAEAEVALMRWEVRIAGEKLVALVNRLVELENAPVRRARRRLRGGRARVSPGQIADAAASEAGEAGSNQS